MIHFPISKEEFFQNFFEKSRHYFEAQLQGKNLIGLMSMSQYMLVNLAH